MKCQGAYKQVTPSRATVYTQAHPGPPSSQGHPKQAGDNLHMRGGDLGVSLG